MEHLTWPYPGVIHLILHDNTFGEWNFPTLQIYKYDSILKIYWILLGESQTTAFGKISVALFIWTKNLGALNKNLLNFKNLMLRNYQMKKLYNTFYEIWVCQKGNIMFKLSYSYTVRLLH